MEVTNRPPMRAVIRGRGCGAEATNPLEPRPGFFEDEEHKEPGGEPDVMEDREAKQFFSSLKEKDLVTWSTLVAGPCTYWIPSRSQLTSRRLPHLSELSLWYIRKGIQFYSLKAGIDSRWLLGILLMSLYSKWVGCLLKSLAIFFHIGQAETVDYAFHAIGNVPRIAINSEKLTWNHRKCERNFKFCKMSIQIFPHSTASLLWVSLSVWYKDMGPIAF
ncbi:hypothetical protein Cgig2_017308 [Carnegiea gigantea]|uniref:Uncharacterized protein n=1 Tax=Carnegiea gigantea TaxID=171969 RepID=A0A9Q1GNX1_9CARY|nr:hypothetical protein Cgig2_017308 [Carnegiea gigantea]